MAQLTPDQLNALLTFASAQLGVSPDRLRQTVQTGNTDALSGAVGSQTAAQIGALLNDRQALERLLQSPQAKEILKQLGGA